MSGCALSGKTNQNSNNNTPSSTLASSFDINNLDTWDTFSSKEWNLSFKHPQQWKLAKEEGAQYQHIFIFKDEITDKNLFQVTIEPLSFAPVKIESDSDGDFTTKTQQEINSLREKIKKSPSLILASKTPALLSTNYDIPGGGFHRRAQFYINNDLVTITLVLGIESPTIPWGEEKRRIVQKTIDDINQGNGGPEAKESLAIFENIINSLEIL